MKFKKLLLLPLIAMCLSGCNKVKEEVIDRSDVNALLPTPITDSFKFAQADQLEGKRFAHRDTEPDSDHLGYVTLRSCTDGDTANFIQDDYRDDYNNYITIKTRFLGVNTPESTAKVEPWGKKASIFTKHVLTEAQEAADQATANDTTGKKHYNIALINHPSKDSFDEKDSSGNRWLAFIWYRPSEEANWRLLNLELVEQAYSRNQLFVDDPVCNYRSSFEKAEARNEKGGYRLYGEADPDYDYEEITYEYSLWSIVHHYDDIGITEEGGSGLLLLVTALVVGIQGDNMFLRDVLHDKEQTDDEYQGLYAYAGFNSSLCSILQNASSNQGLNENGLGVIVRFYCRATQYSGNVQLSDVKTNTSGKKAIKTVTEAKFDSYKQEYSWSREAEEKGEELSFADLNKNYDAEVLNTSNISSSSDLGRYQYHFVETDIVIRSVNPTDVDDDGSAINAQEPYWYKGTEGSRAYTVYAYIPGRNNAKIYTNLRIDDSLYPYVEKAFWGTADPTDLTSSNSPVGKTFKVTGFLVAYFDKYQIQLPNNYSEMNYITAK